MSKFVTDLTILIDSTGSMSGVKEHVVKAMNHFIRDQKRILVGQCNVTISHFNSSRGVSTPIKNVPASSLPVFRSEDYKINGCTNLYDSIMKVLKAADTRHKKDPPKRKIFVLISDGDDNESRYYNQEMIRDEIKARVAQNEGWQFLYIGVGDDFEYMAKGLGFDLRETICIPQGRSNKAYASYYDRLTKGLKSVSTVVLRHRLGRQDDVHFSDDMRREVSL